MQQQAVPFHQVLQALSFFQGPEMTFFVASEYPLYLKKWSWHDADAESLHK